MAIEHYLARAALYYVRRDNYIDLLRLIEIIEEDQSPQHKAANRPKLFGALEQLCRIGFIEIGYRNFPFIYRSLTAKDSRSFHKRISHLATPGRAWVSIGRNALDCQSTLNVSFENLYNAGDSDITVKPLFGPALERSADAFVAMPFRPDMQAVFDDGIRPACRDAKLLVTRGDDIFGSHQIVHDIWSSIFEAKHVIADCTGMNANVFYEIGIAHTLGKHTILISQRKEDVPFDVQHWRWVLYDPTNLPSLRSELAAFLAENVRLAKKKEFSHRPHLMPAMRP